MKVSHIFAPLLCACFLFLAAGCIQNPQGTPATSVVTTVPLPSTPAPTTAPTAPAGSAPMTSKDELVRFVKDAVAYAKANGKTAALAEFDKRNGLFFKGEFYMNEDVAKVAGAALKKAIAPK